MPRKPSAKKGPSAADKHIGMRVRVLRLQAGWSQTNLAQKIGLTFQQVQKYEKGANRISGGRLQEIADLFGVDITEFYTGIPNKSGTSRATGVEASDPVLLLAQSREGMRAVRAIIRLEAYPTVQVAFVRMTEAMADALDKAK